MSSKFVFLILMCVVVTRANADDYVTDWVFFHKTMHDFAIQDFKESLRQDYQEITWEQSRQLALEKVYEGWSRADE